MSSLSLSSFDCVGSAEQQQPEDGRLEGGGCLFPSSAAASSVRQVVGCDDNSSFLTSASRSAPADSAIAAAPPSSSSFSSSESFAAAPPPSSDSTAASSRRRFQPPLAAQRSQWLRLTSSCFLLCLNIAQLSFHSAVICIALYLLCLGDDVQSVAAASTLPSAFACLLVVISTLLLRSVVASALIVLRVLNPLLWRQSAPAWYRVVQRLLLAMSAVAATVALAVLISIPVPPTSSLLFAWLLLWGCTGGEVFGCLLTLYLYAHLHLVFPHSSLSLLPPHVPVGDDDADEAEEAMRATDGQVTRAQLDAVPCLTYRESLRCDRLCCICILDMQAGDRIRLFSCGHGFHQPCVDAWLLQRKVCPMCVQRVRVPPAAAAVEMVAATPAVGDGSDR